MVIGPAAEAVVTVIEAARTAASRALARSRRSARGRAARSAPPWLSHPERVCTAVGGDLPPVHPVPHPRLSPRCTPRPPPRRPRSAPRPTRPGRRAGRSRRRSRTHSTTDPASAVSRQYATTARSDTRCAGSRITDGVLMATSLGGGNVGFPGRPGKPVVDGHCNARQPREVPVRMWSAAGRRVVGPVVSPRARCTAIAASTVTTPAATVPAGTARGSGGRGARGRPGRRARIRCSGGDSADPALWYDSSEAADIAEPIDPAEANEPTLANDANEAALPIERTESWEQIESSEFSDQSDHTPAA